MSKDNMPQSNDIIFYSSPSGDVRVEVFFQEETFWLNQKKMAELFGVDVRTVNEHLQNIYKTNELDKNSTIRNIRIVQKEGNRGVSHLCPNCLTVIQAIRPPEISNTLSSTSNVAVCTPDVIPLALLPVPNR